MLGAELISRASLSPFALRAVKAPNSKVTDLQLVFESAIAGRIQAGGAAGKGHRTRANGMELRHFEVTCQLVA